MAANKTLNTTSLSIEVKSGEDKMGDPIYTKKTFSNIKNNADPQNVLDVANAIKTVLAQETGDCFITESSILSE